MRVLFLVFSVLFLPSSYASVCESELVGRTLVWRAPSRSAEMSVWEFDWARDVIEKYNRELFASVTKPRIFEVKSKTPLEDYTRAVFRTALGEEVRSIQKWNREAASREWLGFHQLRALFSRQENINAEITLLEELLISAQNPRAEDYARWKADLEKERTSISTEIAHTEKWMEIQLPNGKVLKELQEFFVDFMKVLEQEDLALMKSQSSRFSCKQDSLKLARRLVGGTLLRALSAESPRNMYAQIVLNALLDTSKVAFRDGTESGSSISDKLVYRLREHMWRYQHSVRR